MSSAIIAIYGAFIVQGRQPGCPMEIMGVVGEEGHKTRSMVTKISGHHYVFQGTDSLVGCLAIIVGSGLSSPT